MRARSSEAGFTLPELIGVMILVAVLAAVALPKFDAAISLRGDAWRDEVVSALRHAHQTAVSHRRLVCAVVGATTVTLTIAANNPASACTASLPGPDGGSAYTTATGGTTASVSPAGTLYFQPSGRVTSDGAGNTASDRSITIGTTTTVVVVGETGHVR
jgi:MSHA pilin protein MshC